MPSWNENRRQEGKCFLELSRKAGQGDLEVLGVEKAEPTAPSWRRRPNGRSYLATSDWLNENSSCSVSCPIMPKFLGLKATSLSQSTARSGSEEKAPTFILFVPRRSQEAREREKERIVRFIGPPIVFSRVPEGPVLSTLCPPRRAKGVCNQGTSGRKRKRGRGRGLAIKRFTSFIWFRSVQASGEFIPHKGIREKEEKAISLRSDVEVEVLFRFSHRGWDSCPHDLRSGGKSTLQGKGKETKEQEENMEEDSWKNGVSVVIKGAGSVVD